MESLIKYKLSFNKIKSMVSSRKKGDDPIRVHYVYVGSQESKCWVFDDEACLIDGVLVNVGFEGGQDEGYKFSVTQHYWENPAGDAGFLNYLHAWGYLQLIKAKKAA